MYRHRLLFGLVLALSFLGCAEEEYSAISEPYNRAIYVRGSFFPDANSWNVCDDRNRFTFLGRTAYEAKLKLEVGHYDFKIADDSWEWVNLGAEHPNQVIVVGEAARIAYSQNITDLHLQVEDAGTYKFALYASNRWKPILVVVKD